MAGRVTVECEARGWRFDVVCDARISDVADTALAGLRCSSRSEPDVENRFEVSHSGGEPGRWSVFMDGRLMMSGEQISEAFDALFIFLNQRVVAARPDVLSFHASSVAVRGSAILAPAASGSGKTTLCAALLEAGADYLSDESVGVSSDGRLLGYAKPLSFKAGTRSFFDDLDLHAFELDEGRQTVWQVPPAILGGRPVPSASPSMVLLPQYVAGSGVEIETLPPHRAAEALISQTQNLSTYGMASALRLIGSLLSTSVVARVTFGDARDAARPVLAMLEEAANASSSQAFELWSPAPGSSERREADVAPERDVHGLTFRDGGLLVREESGAMISLDSVGARMWSLLARRDRPIPSLVAELTEIFDASRDEIDQGLRGWLAMLRSQGFVSVDS